MLDSNIALSDRMMSNVVSEELIGKDVGTKGEGVSSSTLQVLCECYTVDIGKLLPFPADMSTDIARTTIQILTKYSHLPPDMITSIMSTTIQRPINYCAREIQ